MKKMRTAAMALALTMMLGLTACSGETGEVPVQQVGMLVRATLSADRFAGVVVSENAVTVNRDADKTIKELCVQEGDEVTSGQKLFSYDSEELSLNLDKQELEMDRLEADISDTEKQITEVEKEIKKATSEDTKTQLNIQLRQLQTELTQAKYDKSSLQADIDYTKKMLEDVDVRSPIDGTIRKIDATGETYITIQQTGAYQVKGQLNELSLSAGIMEGTAVTVISRVDENQTWSGVVSMVDYNSTESNSYDAMYGYSSAYTSSTSYPFYITLDATEGLLLGQHVYIQVAAGTEALEDAVRVPEAYVMDITYDEEQGATVGDVWTVDAEGKLVKAQVVLGDYDTTISGYVILSGLTEQDYIADPANPACQEGAQTSLRSESDFAGAGTAQTTVPVDDTAEIELTETTAESVPG